MYEVYSKEGCGACTKAKSSLRAKQLPFSEYILNQDITRKELFEMFPAAKTLPIILEDGRMIGGFAELESHLNQR